MLLRVYGCSFSDISKRHNLTTNSLFLLPLQSNLHTSLTPKTQWSRTLFCELGHWTACQSGTQLHPLHPETSLFYFLGFWLWLFQGHHIMLVLLWDAHLTYHCIISFCGYWSLSVNFFSLGLIFVNMLLALFLYLSANTLLLLFKCFCEHGCPNNPKNLQIILLVKSENVHCFLDYTPSLYTVFKHMQPPKCVWK